MLMYAALTVAGVIAAALLVWILKLVVEALKSAHNAFSPAARKTRLAHLNANFDSTPAPWGWGDKQAVVAGGRFDGSSERRAGENISPRAASNQGRNERHRDRINEQAAWERFEHSENMTSVRNVLTGYDMKKDVPESKTDWASHNSFDTLHSAHKPKTLVEQSEESKPTKPWGW